MDCKKIEKQLSAYLDQELDERSARKVEEHLAMCQNCKQTLEKLKNYLTLAQEVDPIEAPSWLEARIIQAVDQHEMSSPERETTHVKVIAIRTIAAVAAILILAIIIVPPHYYNSQKVTANFSFRMEKKGKGPGTSKKGKDMHDPQRLLFTRIADSLQGKVVAEDIDVHTGLANSITIRMTKKRYPAFYQWMTELGMAEQFPETLTLTLNPYVTIQVWFPGRKLVTGDFNGDGFDDLACYYYKGHHAGYWFIAYNNRAGNFEKPIPFTFSDTLPCSTGQATFLAGDINGDAFDDLVIYLHPDSPSGRWLVALNDRHGAFLPLRIMDVGADTGFSGDSCSPFVGDLSGDDLDDIGVHVHNGEFTGKWIIQKNLGEDRFGSPELLPIELEGQGARDRYFPLVLDYNGDGWDDALIYWQGGPRSASWIAAANLKNGTFASEFRLLYAFMGDYIPFPGDFNGDGYADFLVKLGPMDEQGEWYMMINNKKGRFENTYEVLIGSQPDFIVE